MTALTDGCVSEHSPGSNPRCTHTPAGGHRPTGAHSPVAALVPGDSAEGDCNPPAGPTVVQTQWYTVQALDRDGALVTSTNWHKTQQAAEESAARLVRINGALCWIVQREDVTTLGEWAPLPAIGGEL